MSTEPLTLTGERTIPGIAHENYWFRRHEAGYAAVPARAPRSSRVVLDAGCGEGYGGPLLTSALPLARVLGVDYDRRATAHAAAAHGGPATAYLRGALTALPLAPDVADLTLSLQVLEHIWTPAEYVRELTRVTRRGGVVVLSTPNRLTFSPGLRRRQRPANVFHCREYDAAELRAELGRWSSDLVVTEVLGLRHGPRLHRWEARHGSLTAAQAAPPEKWDAALTEVVASVTAADFELSGADLDTSHDLVVVARVRS